MIIEANDINSATLKKVVIGRRLITSSCNRARGIITLNNLCQVLSEQRLNREFAILSQCRGIVTGIQYQVCLLKSKGISLGRRPLFEYLITYRPHKDTGVITVSQDKVSQIALMPLIEESGIIILSLTTTPHIKALVHHYDTHGIAHIQKFRSRRVMRTADGINTHGLKFGELAVQSIFI